MPEIFNVSGLTWNGKEVLSYSEAILETVFEKAALRDVHTIVPGIQAKQQIIFLGLLGKVGYKRALCDTTVSDATIGSSEKFWDPQYMGDRLEECADDIMESFWVWGLQKGVKKADLTDTDFALFVTERLTDAVYEMIWRMIWFGNTAENNVGASPNPGHITVGVDKKFFTAFDGYFAQGEDIVAADSNRYIDSLQAKNAEATYADQEFDDTDTTNKLVTKALNKLKTKADTRLRGKADGFFLTTLSVADQYARELESVGVTPSFERIENGYSILRYNGINIIALDIWDRIIREDFDSGSNYFRPHRMVYTTKSNLWVGTEEEGDFGNFEAFFDKYHKVWVEDFGFNLDAKVGEDYLTQWAY